MHIVDAQKELWRTENGDSVEHSFSAPGNCNSIDISFRLKGSSRGVKTVVYDGERMVKAEEAIARGFRKPEDVEKADSSHYDKLEPVVLRYFAAVQENEKLRNKEA